MTLTIDFTPQEEAWLYAEAAQQGVAPAEIVKRLVDERLPFNNNQGAPTPPASPVIDAEGAAAIALLNSYLEAESTADPEEIRRAEEELADFKRNMNANREATGERLVYP